MTVTVSAEAEAVMVVPVGWVEPAVAAVLPVAGGVVTVPAGPNRDDLPYALVDDPAGAAEWAAGVYGEEVAAALEGLRSGQSARLAGVVSDMTRVVTDLARACWVARWWPVVPVVPSPVPGALDLDLGLLAARAGCCPGMDPDALLGRGLEALPRVLHRVGGVPAGLLSRVEGLLVGVLDRAPLVPGSTTALLVQVWAEGQAYDPDWAADPVGVDPLLWVGRHVPRGPVDLDLGEVVRVRAGTSPADEVWVRLYPSGGQVPVLVQAVYGGDGWYEGPLPAGVPAPGRTDLVLPPSLAAGPAAELGPGEWGQVVEALWARHAPDVARPLLAEVTAR